jgi:hypothetical protein
MLTPCDEGERLATGPFDILCIIQESPTAFRAVILEAHDIQGFPHADAMPTIELNIGMASPAVSLANAQAHVKALADRIGFDNANIITDRVIRLSDRPTPIAIPNWNCREKFANALSALCSAVDFIAL